MKKVFEKTRTQTIPGTKILQGPGGLVVNDESRPRPSNPLPAIVFSGSLTDFDISHVLQMVAFEKKTARLHIESERSKAVIMFNEGQIVAAIQNGRTLLAMLSRFLYRDGIITADEFRKLKLFEKDLPLSLEYLIQRGLVRETALKELARVWLLDSVTEIVTWRTGRYELEIVASNQSCTVPGVQLSFDSVVLEASRRADDLVRMKKVIADTSVFVASRNQRRRPLGDIQLLIDNFEWYVQSLLDGTMPVSILCWQPFCTPFQVYEALSNMVQRHEISSLSPTIAAAVNSAHRALKQTRIRTRSHSGRARFILAVISRCVAGAALTFLVLSIGWRLAFKPQAPVSIVSLVPRDSNPAALDGILKTPESPSVEKPSPSTKSAPAAIKRHRRSGADLHEVIALPQLQADPAELIARMEKHLESRNYPAVLETYATLPPEQALMHWPLLCRMRALTALNRTDELELFFHTFHIEDAEYHAAHASHLVRKQDWTKALEVARRAARTPVKYAPSRSLREEIAYATAQAASGIYQQSGNIKSRAAAMEAWFQVKYAYRNEQSHPRYTEANDRIRDLSGVQ